jgi:hypothetical protein
LKWKAVGAMGEHLGAVIWGIAVFIVPAVAMISAAVLIGSIRRRGGKPRQKVTIWIIAPAVIFAGPVLASCAAVVASWRNGAGVLGLLAWGGIALLLLAGLFLAFVYARAAGWALVVLAILLPALAAVTESGWVIDSHTGTPTPESVALGTMALILLFSLPALFSGILLIVGSRPGDPVAGTTATTPDRGTDAAESSTAPGSHTPSPNGRNKRKGLV